MNKTVGSNHSDDITGFTFSPKILDTLLEGCQVISPDGRYLYINDIAARQGRKPKSDLIGKKMVEAYPGIDQTRMYTVLQKTMEDGKHRTMENEFVYGDGSTGWFELRFDRVPVGVFILSLEITQRKLAETKISHLNAVLRGIRNVNQLITREHDPKRLISQACDLLVEARGFESVIIGLIDLPENRVDSFANAGVKLHALETLLHAGSLPDCAEEAVRTRKFVLRNNQSDACRGCSVATGLGEKIDDLALPLIHDGYLFGFMITSLPQGMGKDSDEQNLLQEVASDIAFALNSIQIRSAHNATQIALSNTEAQLQQAQKLEAIGRLAGGIAHDYNNILAAQIGYCDLLQDHLESDSYVSKELVKIKACADRAARLTRQLLAFSRKQAMQVEVLDLNAIVTNFKRMLIRLIGEDLEFNTVLASDLGHVQADPGQIEQVLMNLVVNARDAMPDGGTLTIETANVYLDEDYAKMHVGVVAGPHIQLTVSDTGIGMDKTIQSQLFEPFFTTKETGKGTGLGLATVYGIVKQSSGNIWVYSEPGQGSTFKIYLPKVDEPLTQHLASKKATALGDGELILIVEDDPALLEMFVKMVVKLGYQVKTAPNGKAALELVAAQNLRPAMLLTDVIMPGMNGKQLAEKLGKIQPGLHVLFTSGYTDDAIFHLGVLDSQSMFIQKPFSVDDLAAKIRQVLATR